MRVRHLGLKISALVGFSVVCVGIFLYLFQGAGGKLRFSAPYAITTFVPNAFQLVPNADVRAAGVKVGTVNTIADAKGTTAVKIELQKKYAPVYRNAVVLVRTKTLVGENYIQIDPGTPEAGKVPDGGTLPIANAEDAVQLDQILSAVDAKTRAHVRADLRGLGGALTGNGKSLNRMLAATRPLAQDGGRLLRILAAQREAVARIVDNTGRVMQAFGDRSGAVRSLAVSAKRTAEAVVTRDQQLAQAFRELPSTLRQAQKSSGRLASFSTTAQPVVRDLKLASIDLGPVMRDLGPSARSARSLFKELPPLLKVANPLLTQLRTFASASPPAVRAIDSAITELNPALAYVNPFSRELGSFFGNVGSLNDVADHVGHLGRVFPVLGPASLTALTPTERQLVESMFAPAATTFKEETNAYPQAGSIGDPKPFSGSVPRVPDPSR
jgi:phospholipid/cholesterol/gamma-HCH transport system substrate-binding protein